MKNLTPMLLLAGLFRGNCGPTGAHHLQPELRRRARHRAARFEGRRQFCDLLRRNRAGRAGFCHPARPGGPAFAANREQIIATIPSRRNCCSRSSRARRLILKPADEDNTQTREIIPGKIVRSGYVPRRSTAAHHRSERQTAIQPAGRAAFPDLGDDAVLKPAFNWLLQSDKRASLTRKSATSPAI